MHATHKRDVGPSIYKQCYEQKEVSLRHRIESTYKNWPRNLMKFPSTFQLLDF